MNKIHRFKTWENFSYIMGITILPIFSKYCGWKCSLMYFIIGVFLHSIRASRSIKSLRWPWQMKEIITKKTGKKMKENLLVINDSEGWRVVHITMHLINNYTLLVFANFIFYFDYFFFILIGGKLKKLNL